MEKQTTKKPNKVSYFFYKERHTLLLVSVSGIIYNVGLSATPWFEGQLAQKLFDIIGKKDRPITMLYLALFYIATVLLVQAMRYLKRFYVRRFANNTNKRMKNILYANLISKSTRQIKEESIGEMLTKAVADADACAEGMRKFTTEVFDTGIALVSYTVMLFIYDWRLALISSVFPPFAYMLANYMKKYVTKSASEYKKSSAVLNDATLERVSGETTFRVFSNENNRDNAYNNVLKEYQKKAIIANLWENTLAPLYGVVSMISIVFIIYFGAKNILGTGFSSWNIASFATFISCFMKLSVKSSKAAKLFNSVQKASVSWKRIKPMMNEEKEKEYINKIKADSLEVKNVSLSFGEKNVFKNISFSQNVGEIVGVTGKIASGKSAFGKLFLKEYPFDGEILIGDKSIKDLEPCEYLSYMAHECELMSASVEENISLGDDIDTDKYLKIVCLDEEISALPEGKKTQVGVGGMRFSGGQQARISLARTLAHTKAVTVLDDPFSAVDSETEIKILNNIKKYCAHTNLIIISHRLEFFGELEKIIFLKNGEAKIGTHKFLLENCEDYNLLCSVQNGGERNEK